MKNVLKEPLLHFLLLGAVLFALNAWRDTTRPVAVSSARIEVNAAVIERLRAAYERQFGQPPGVGEMREQVTAHIREEVLFREAVALGLDRDDTIVRRRLAQKMEFLANDIVRAAEPRDAELREFFEKNSSRYARTGRVSFRHVYFSKEKRGPDAESAAREGLVALKNGESDEALGDPFLHGFEFAEREPGDVVAAFGVDFAKQLETQATGKWSGPIASSYGIHLVRVVARTQPDVVTFDAVRETVLRDFNEERRLAANRDIFEKLCQRYDVAVDETALTKAAPIKTAQR
jgi:parvulin-like peptidyl-prolyl isomerase